MLHNHKKNIHEDLSRFAVWINAVWMRIFHSCQEARCHVGVINFPGSFCQRETFGSRNNGGSATPFDYMKYNCQDIKIIHEHSYLTTIYSPRTSKKLTGCSFAMLTCTHACNQTKKQWMRLWRFSLITTPRVSGLPIFQKWAASWTY